MLPQASWPRPRWAPSSSAAASATPATANGSSNSAACSNMLPKLYLLSSRAKRGICFLQNGEMRTEMLRINKMFCLRGWTVFLALLATVGVTAARPQAGAPNGVAMLTVKGEVKQELQLTAADL